MASLSVNRLLYTLSWAPVGLVVCDFIAFPTRVPNTDVANADVLPGGTWAVVSRRKRDSVPERGDMVSMKSPVECETLYRRVVALAGDYVRPRGQPESDSRLVVVPTGSMWVEATTPMDDKTTQDSNDFGPVSLGLVNGRVAYSSRSGVMATECVPSSRIIVPTRRYP
jgi:Signal peptidase, peptidase S26